MEERDVANVLVRVRFPVSARFQFCAILEDMKLCTSCGETKHLADFNKNNSRSDGRGSKCRACMKLYRKEHYEKNKSRLIAEVEARRKLVKAETIELLLSYLQVHPCVDCGNADVRVLEFDHVRGEKSYNISNMVLGGWKWSSILSEIEKCEVRCRNCHTIITAERGGFYRSLWGIDVTG
jgi:hypothetical protein